MTTTFLVVSSLVKVLVILLITVGAFAPILIWAERRQSAMIQDRLGPSRAAIVLPDSAVVFIDRARLPLWRLAALTGIVAIVALITLTFVAIEGSNPLPISTSALTASLVGFGAASVLLRAGYGVHTMIVRNGGRIMLIGLLHPLADAIKFIFKEDFVPPKSDKLLFSAGPIIALIPAIAAFAVIPFASTLHWDYLNQVLPRTGEIAGPAVPMQVASINVGILFIFAIASTGVIGAAISGYASDNKYSLLGGIRAASQMVSYEVVLGLTLVPAFMVYASLRLEDMAMWQHQHMWGIFIPPLTLAAINFFVAAVAETKRVPFDLPEGESELVGGYLTEYSGMKFGMFFMGEFVEVVSLAAIASVLFLGGWDVPYLYRDGFEFTLPFVAGSLSVPPCHCVGRVCCQSPYSTFWSLGPLCCRVGSTSGSRSTRSSSEVAHGSRSESHQEARTNHRRTGLHSGDRQRPRLRDGSLLQEHLRAAGQEGNRDGEVSGGESGVPGAVSRHSPPHAAHRRLPALRRVPLLQHGVPCAMHLHRAGRVRARRSTLRLRALPFGLHDRRAPLHLLRLLRRGVPLRCDSNGYRHAHAPLDPTGALPLRQGDPAFDPGTGRELPHGQPAS
jgi:NADH-quinone oxidoreductase subunit H